MADYERHAPLFDLTLAALGRTPVTREIYASVVDGDVCLDALTTDLDGVHLDRAAGVGIIAGAVEVQGILARSARGSLRGCRALPI